MYRQCRDVHPYQLLSQNMIAGDGARGCFQREGMLVLDGYIMEWFTKDGYTIRLESHFCEALEQDLLFTKEEIGIFKHYVMFIN